MHLLSVIYLSEVVHFLNVLHVNHIHRRTSHQPITVNQPATFGGVVSLFCSHASLCQRLCVFALKLHWNLLTQSCNSCFNHCSGLSENTMKNFIVLMFSKKCPVSSSIWLRWVKLRSVPYVSHLIILWSYDHICWCHTDAIFFSFFFLIEVLWQCHT